MTLKTHLSFIFVVAILSVGNLTFAQNKVDSTAISNYFEKFTTSPDSLKKTVNHFKAKVPKDQLDQFYYHYSKYLLQHGQIVEGGNEASKGITLFKNDTVHKKIVKLYNLKAASHSMQKEYVEAIQYFNKSIAISEKFGNKKQSAYLQNNIANIFFSLQDYVSAHEYALRAFENIKEFQDDPYHNQILSVLSVAEAKIGKTEVAQNHAEQALNEALSKNDLPAIIIAQYALGDIYLSKKNFTRAKNYFSNSLELSESIQNYHFSMLNSIGLLTTCVELKEYSLAIEYGEKGIALSKTLQNDNIHYSVYRHLARAYSGIGDNENAYKHLLVAHEIYKETTNSEKQKSINDILIKYDTEKKEKELARKNVLLLEQDVKVSRFLLIILSLFIIIVILSFYFSFQRSKAKQLAEKIAIENERKTLDAIIQGEEIERTRIANELHDGLASSLTAVRFKLESLKDQDELGRKELISMLQSTHEDTRRIAHNLSPLLIEEHGLTEALRVFCNENSCPNCTISSNITGNISSLSKEYAILSYRFIQELVQNALKHAHATSISVNLFCDPEELRIMVEDNGVGFEFHRETLNGGLLSLLKRIENLKGSLEVDSSLKNGTVIMIQLPLF